MTHHDSGPHDQSQHWSPGPGEAGPGAVRHRVQGGQSQEVAKHRMCWGACHWSVVTIETCDWLILTWNTVLIPLPWLLKLKVDTDKYKENNEDESCGTVNHDVFSGPKYNVYLYLLRSCLFDNSSVTDHPVKEGL